MTGSPGQMRKRRRNLIIKLLGVFLIVLLLMRCSWLPSIFLNFEQIRNREQNVKHGETEQAIEAGQKSIIREIMKQPEDRCTIPHFKNVARIDLLKESDCVRVKPLQSSCKLAKELFGDPSSLDITMACKRQDVKEYCRFEGGPEEWHVTCNPSSCDKTMFLGTTEVKTGTRSWFPYSSYQDLQEHINSLYELENLGYCLLHCGKESDLDRLEYYFDSVENHLQSQILNLPPLPPKVKIQNKHNHINLNFIFIDSVSRHHLFRSLPRSVSMLDKITGDKQNEVLLLDFELVQGVRSRTFETLQALFSGEINPFDVPFGTQEMPREKLKLEKLLKPLKTLNFSNIWIEDLCPYWEWGIIKDLLIYNSSLSKEELHEQLMEAISSAGIDSLGNTLTSCDILRTNDVPDPFHGPSKICYNGKHQHEYLFEYLTYYQSTMIQRSQPFFSFFETNVGHEGSGKRIQYFDLSLSEYLNFAKNLLNTLTVVFSDHGNAYGKFVTKSPQARTEMYQPFLFMIIPKSTQAFFTKTEIRSLLINQQRLISILDLHYSIAYIIEKLHDGLDLATHESQKRFSQFKSEVSDFNKQFNITRSGLFSEISSRRTCSHIPRIMPNLCICQGYDVTSHNLFYHVILAMHFVGVINNEIQRQRKKENLIPEVTPSRGGFGSCQRLKVDKIQNIQMSSQDPHTEIVKMDLYVRAPNQKASADIFFISVRVDHQSTLSLGSFERITPYSRYSACKDKGVDVKLCTCEMSENSSSLVDKSKHQDLESQGMKENKDVLHYISSMLKSDLQSNISVLSVNGHDCLYIIFQSNQAGVVYEAYNTCTVTLTLDVTLDSVNLLLSGEKKQRIVMLPLDFTFLVAGVSNTKHAWSCDIQITYIIQ